MKQKKQILIIILSLIAGIVIGGIGLSLVKSGSTPTINSEHSNGKQLYSCGMHPDVISEEPGNCPICGMKLTPIKGGDTGSATNSGEKKKGKILYWQAPMDPTYISDKPGKSPMGMDLVPVYEGEQGGGSGDILIDPATVQNMGIKTTIVQKRPLSRTIRTVGVIKYNEKNLYFVNAKISGWIEKLYADFKGQTVKKGKPLLEIYSPELVSAQEEYLLSLKNYRQLKDSPMDDIRENAATLLAASRNRLLNWDIPQQAINDLESRGKITKTMVLAAPANGVITQMNAREGAFVKAGTDLYHIADLSTVWVEVSVYEYEIPWIKLNMPAKMELSYLPGETFSGKVVFIYPFLDQKTRNLKVRLEFSNPNLKLKPDMYANIYLESLTNKKTLVVPTESVIRTGDRNLVFIKREQGKFEPREVKLGREGEDGLIEIVSGLLEGEEVVTSGQFLLDSESKAQEAIKKMLEAKSKKQSQEEKGNDTMKDMKDMKNMGQKKEQASAEPMPAEKIVSANGAKEHGEHSHDSLALYTCPMHPDFVSDNPDQPCPECGMKLEKKKDISADTELYTCPMHPEFVTDDPDARCSICEMKLVKKEK